MVIEDIESIYRIECESFSVPWSIEALKQEVSNPIAFYHVAAIGDQVVAYGGMRDVLGEGEITNIAVDKDYRGQGIGKNLLNSLLEHARQRAMDTITLEVRSSNEIAKTLYGSYHFREIAIRKAYYQKPIEDAIIMQLQIEKAY